MARATIVTWRDIPAQVIVGKGRAAAKVQLSERFEQAIDRAAMRAGARDQEAYLAEWRRTDAGNVEDDPSGAAAALAAKLERDYPPEALRRLVENEGLAPEAPARSAAASTEGER